MPLHEEKAIVVNSRSLTAITLDCGLTDRGIQAASLIDIAGSKPGPEQTRDEVIYGFKAPIRRLPLENAPR